MIFDGMLHYLQTRNTWDQKCIVNPHLLIIMMSDGQGELKEPEN